MSIPELDPQIADALRKLEEAGVRPLETLTLEEAREEYARGVALLGGEPDEVFAVEEADADGVPLRVYRPVETDEPSMALVYFHGGGWAVGGLDTHDGVARALAKRAGIVVVSVGYSLAPESRYPAALQDAWQATNWVLANAASLGIDPERVGVGGDGVGGCLAAVVARKGRDAGTPFAVQLLIYPTTTSRCDTQAFSLYSMGYGLTRDAMHWNWNHYIGDYDGGADTDVSPAALQDLRRLPRAIVVTAEADILRDEGEAYAQRLFLAGVETEGYRYDGMINGFLQMAGLVSRSDKALDEIAESLRPFLEKTWRDDYSVSLDK
jgi:acetyl esterase